MTNKPKDEMLYRVKKWEDLLDYSTNLMGGFQPQDNYIQLCGDPYFREEWDFISKVKEPKHIDDFVIDESKGWFFLKIGDINKTYFPYSQIARGSGNATASVEHKPSNSNYWHFTIQWKDGDGNPISRNAATWKHGVVAAMRAAISEHFKTALPQEQIVRKQLYCKPGRWFF